MGDRELMAAVEEILTAEAERLHGEYAADLRGELAELLPQVTALIDRTERVAALRAAKGRGLSEANQLMLGRLRDRLDRLVAMIEEGALG